MLKGAIVYALACASGAVLGVACVKAGARAYIGYDADFTFMRLNRFRTHSQDDSLAKLFSEPSNLVGTTLIQGVDYGEHVIEILINNPGLQAFTFTFG